MNFGRKTTISNPWLILSLVLIVSGSVHGSNWNSRWSDSGTTTLSDGVMYVYMTAEGREDRYYVSRLLVLDCRDKNGTDDRYGYDCHEKKSRLIKNFLNSISSRTGDDLISNNVYLALPDTEDDIEMEAKRQAVIRHEKNRGMTIYII